MSEALSEEFDAEQIQAEIEDLDTAVFEPIGIIKNRVARPMFRDYGEVDSSIFINQKFNEAFYGLGDYSHLVLVWWMHLIKSCELRHVPQGMRGEVPEVGIFACRCAQRPTKIAVTTVKILEINEKHNEIVVNGLDASTGSPVLDIKPYTPQFDLHRGMSEEALKIIYDEVRIPEWTKKLIY